MEGRPAHAHDLRRAAAPPRRRPPSGARRWLAPLAALLLVLAGLAGVAIVASPARRHVTLDDGTVWVTSLKDRKAARYNVRSEQADAAVPASSPRFDVAQWGSSTLLDEAGVVTSIRASSVETLSGTRTGRSMTAMIGAGTAVLLDTATGDVWTGDPERADSLSPTATQPRMSLGAGGRAVVDADGRVWGYRPADGMVLALDPSGPLGAKEMGSLTSGTRADADSFTVVGGVPVITSGARVLSGTGETRIASEGRLVAQAPPVDGSQSGWVAVAGRRGLYLMDPTRAGEDPVALLSGGHGTPALPISSGGCVYAAWSQRANNYVSVCTPEGSGAAFASLESVRAASELVFRANHRQVVLNDVSGGDVWNPGDSTDVIRVQWNRLRMQRSEKRGESDGTADGPQRRDKTCSRRPGGISAQKDTFAARAGGTRILDVLRNDRQTDCSVLTVTKVGAPNGADIAVSPVYDGRYLQLDASRAGTGTASFSYEISDGRGQTSSATVELTLTSGGGNAPAQTDAPPELTVEQGAVHTFNALGGFADPDGDPLALVSAVPKDCDQVAVSTRADGRLTFSAGSMSSGRVGVELTVSDGRHTGNGMVYYSVEPAGTLPADIDPAAASAPPGVETSIDLKPYVHSTGAGQTRLSSVDAPDGAAVTADPNGMSLRFTAAEPGTYHIPYTIMQGSVPADGMVRVEVRPVSGESARPVAANDVALIGPRSTAIVEPLSNDVDPMGGVLAVTAVSAPASSGIRTGLVDHRRVYLTAHRIPTQPVEITYTVTNAAGSSRGTIVLQPPSPSVGAAAPKAGDIEVGVRTGGIVSVDVTDHVSHADGAAITLRHDLHTEEGFQGLTFVSGNTVRYQAPGMPGVHPITYTVTDDLGNRDSGTITVTVHESDARTKTAPAPRDVEAQVAAGRTVRVPIALSGIDADGDDVQLLGLGNAAPRLGRVTEVGADHILYEAYGDSSGTDAFSYAVEDWTGQRAQGRIRVGVFRTAPDSGVVARDDDITLRPGTAAAVPVTLNDICGDGNPRLTGEVDARGVPGTHVRDGSIEFTAPREEGTRRIVYTVEDKAGASDTGMLTVHVDADAPIKPPDAHDYRIPSASTIDKKSVDVDMSQWIANPSGPTSDLRVDVHGSARGHARVADGAGQAVITVDLTRQARAVPYTVTNTRHHIVSTAFIHVPAYGVFPPMPRPKAPALKVNAGQSILIDIADHVRVGAGKEPHVDGAGSVSATKAADGDLYVNDRTLRFTAPRDYAGPASITFTAVDGRAGRDQTRFVSSAVITLPITVIGHDVPPPTFSSPTIDVEAGENATTIDLKALTHSSDGMGNGKRYTYSGGASTAGVDAVVRPDGGMRVKARRDAAPGTTVNVPVHVTHDEGTLDAGVTVRVVSSTRPLARLEDRTVTVEAGGTGTVRLFDDAYNPFPDEALAVARCPSEDAAPGLTIRCGPDGGISIAAARGTGAVSTRMSVTVEDATKAPERRVTGMIAVFVTDRPEAPLLSPVDARPQDGAVDLTWTPGPANGSPITDYEVRWDADGEGAKRSCGPATACRINGLVNGRAYTFHVRARNGVGWSADSNGVVGRPDRTPPAPVSVRADGGFERVGVDWVPAEYDGSSVDHYTVRLSNGMTSVVRDGTSTVFTIPTKDIMDGRSVTASVAAHNAAGDGPATVSAPARPYGRPDAPTVSAAQNGANSAEMTVTIGLGNMRNTTCDGILMSLGGKPSHQRTLPCSATSTSLRIEDSDFGTTLVPQARVTTTEGESSEVGVGRPVTPDYRPSPPTDLAIGVSGGACVVSWRGADAKAVAYGYTDGNGRTGTTDKESFSYVTAPWTPCGSVRVWSVFDGRTNSDESTASADPDLIALRPPAKVEGFRLAWDGRDTLRLTGGTVDTYGMKATVVLTLRDSAGSVATRTWTSGEPCPKAFDLGNAGLEGDVTWRLTLKDGPSALTDISGDGKTVGRVDGARPRPSAQDVHAAQAAPKPAGTANERQGERDEPHPR